MKQKPDATILALIALVIALFMIFVFLVVSIAVTAFSRVDTVNFMSPDMTASVSGDGVAIVCSNADCYGYTSVSQPEPTPEPEPEIDAETVNSRLNALSLFLTALLIAGLFTAFLMSR